MKVCVLGAGIVGCATAYQLARQGHEVQLVDEADGPGQLTSRANGAQLSYSYVEPLASPHTLVSLPGMLLSSNSPLRFSAQWDWRQWAWGLQFLGACTPGQVRAGTEKLLQLSSLSRQTLAQWMQDEDWSFDFQRNGKLVLCATSASLERQRAQIALQQQWGCVQTVLSAQECVAREPALQHYGERFVGGVWTADECVADPYRLCQHLAGGVQRLGGTVSWNTRLLGFETRADRLLGARTDQGLLQADTFVLATGASVARHAAMLGLYLPVYPIKGYSITVPIQDRARVPRASVTDLSLKTVFAPLGNMLRVAAMAEVGGYDLSIPHTRIAAIAASVETVFPGACDLSNPATWAGLRPATPNALPVIGRRKFQNLFLNAGHGALGLTLAPWPPAVPMRCRKRLPSTSRGP
jgi:D-amino-acid dehydrogenase